TDGELFEVFFWYHNVARGLGGGGLRGHPWYQYAGFFAVYFLPWSPLLLVAAWLTWRRGLWHGDAELRLGLVWFATVLVVLSCARFTRADSLLPAYPGAAPFLACALLRPNPPGPPSLAGKGGEGLAPPFPAREGGPGGLGAALLVLVLAALVWL